MFGENDFSSNSGHGAEASKSLTVKQSDSEVNLDKTDEKMGFSDKGLETGESEVRHGGGIQSKPNQGNLISKELPLSYLSENGKLPFPPEKNLPNSKGKDVVLEGSCDDERWVVRDFLQLNENGVSSKREIDDEGEREKNSGRGKKPKMETLNLSLALPDVSLTLNSSNPVQNVDPQPHVPIRPSRSLQSLAISNNMTQTTCSDDFTAASLSYSYSHPFSHNPSCSLTRNSTENYEHSMGSHRRENDHIWNCGEGTNGSVHSRFRPIGDGVALAGLGHMSMNGGRSVNNDLSNSFYKAASSDNNSFFPSELEARPKMGTFSAESRDRPSESFRVPDALDNRTPLRLSSRSAKIVAQCITESITVVSQVFQELPDETVQSIKEYLRNLIAAPEGKDELNSLQNRLEHRSDLTRETLSRSHRLQLEILVAVKFGLGEFVSQRVQVPTAELGEIFLLLRCRNVNCKSPLPVDDCECKICSTKKGFCSQCMCPVCLNFDCANNTCSWVGCDVCAHWCHASCGIEKNFIRSGNSSKGNSRAPGIQFYCPGCGHASEMLGFIKEVFLCCAKSWSAQTLIKELDCVRKIFKASDDVKGKVLYLKAQETIYRLDRGSGTSDSLAASPSIAPKDVTSSQPLPTKETVPFTSSNPISLSTSSSSMLRHMLPHNDLLQSPSMKPSLMSDVSRDFLSAKLLNNNDSFESLESIVRIKEAEARMFQVRADEARKEAETYHQMGRMQAEKLEEEYAEKLAKLCLQETEERRRKKIEELKVLESSHCDYYNMKMRMQAEIAGLLERMEATKKQWV
ncbi:hypothetical protein V2J09_015133 [Rumex salicifolius]